MSIHGHSLLVQYIINNKIETKGKTMIEIGSTREVINNQNSTLYLSNFCNKNGIHFITVDMDPENTKNAKKQLSEINSSFEAINSKGEDFLKTFDKKIDFIYLDAFDYYHQHHSKKRNDAYKKYLNKTINNDDCWNMHLECAKNIKDKISIDGIICFDDILDKQYNGKGKLAIPYLVNNGYKIQVYYPNALIMSRK